MKGNGKDLYTKGKSGRITSSTMTGKGKGGKKKGGTVFDHRSGGGPWGPWGWGKGPGPGKGPGGGDGDGGASGSGGAPAIIA